jgi:hypothetical protein
LYTIEIKPEFYTNLIRNYNGNKIKFILGDSSVVLDDLTKHITGNSVFFLDGHWSAGNTGRGTKDCPLYEELKSIHDNFKPKGIIIIDDVRLFGNGPNNGEICNWEDISTEKILSIMNDRIKNAYMLPSCLHPEDRFVIEFE